jgi:hypothetical protein
LWRLVKDGHVAEARVRPIDGIGLELRYEWDGDLRVSQMFKACGELEEAATVKRSLKPVAGGQPGRRKLTAGRRASRRDPMKEFTFAGTVSVPGFVQKVLRKPIVESPRVCLMK